MQRVIGLDMGTSLFGPKEHVLVIFEIILSFQKKRKIPPGQINMYEMSISEVHSGNIDPCLLICASPSPYIMIYSFNIDCDDDS